MKPVLDACCGSRMFWIDRKNPSALFMDVRMETHVLCDGRALEIRPDVVADFRAMPFPNKAFKLVVFDPPHLLKAGAKSWMAKKYGLLDRETWQSDILEGFNECWRVLDDWGTLIFKWSEKDVKLKTVLDLIPYRPLFGHPSGKAGMTHWLCFLKQPSRVKDSRRKSAFRGYKLQRGTPHPVAAHKLDRKRTRSHVPSLA